MEEFVSVTCPHCGGKLRFDDKKQLVICESCGTSFAPYRLLQYDNELSDEDVTFGVGETTERDHLVLNTCSSCGAEVMLLDTVAASTCPYCGNNILVKRSLTGDFRPKYVIPFKHNIEDATIELNQLLSHRHYLSKKFKETIKNAKLVGTYVPYFIYGGDVACKMSFIMSYTNQSEVGMALVADIAIFSIFAAIGLGAEEGLVSPGEIQKEDSLVTLGARMSFAHLGIDALDELDDNIALRLEPFDNKEVRPFNSSYLSGYVAKRYDSNLEEVENRARKVFEKAMEKELNKVYFEISNKTLKVKDVKLARINANYALYPVYIANYKWEDKEYQLAINGQTGKIAIDLPVSKPKVCLYFAIAFTTIAFILYWFVYLFSKNILVSSIVASSVSLLVSLFISFCSSYEYKAPKHLDSSLYAEKDSLKVYKLDKVKENKVRKYDETNYKQLINLFKYNKQSERSIEELKLLIVYLKDEIRTYDNQVNVLRRRLSVGAIKQNEFNLLLSKIETKNKKIKDILEEVQEYDK